MADKDTMYVVHGAETTCNRGLRKSKLVLQNDHGIFIRKKAQMTVMDCKANQNVLPFGGCLSMENPETQLKMIGKTPVIKMNSFSTGAEGVFCNPITQVALVSCAGICAPIIISPSWENGKEDTDLKEEKALLGKGTLTCLYGGIITIEDAGQ